MLGLPNSFEMVDSLPASDPRQNQALFILPIVRDDKRNRLSNRLLSTEATHTLCPPIPTCDHTIEVLADNRIVIVFDDRCQRTQPLFTFAQCRFEVLSVCNVDSRGV